VRTGPAADCITSSQSTFGICDAVKAGFGLVVGHPGRAVTFLLFTKRVDALVR
jgi:hypothetical protein